MELESPLLTKLKAKLSCESDLIANLANASALIMQEMDDLLWAGFYILQDDRLVLGPFQGPPACTRIARGRGVCGKAVLEEKSILVDDVNQFSDHIACDERSRSELVVPIFIEAKQGEPTLYGVLDLDSESLGRFHEKERELMETFVEILGAWISGNS